jgi:hypothetical protein
MSITPITPRTPMPTDMRKKNEHLAGETCHHVHQTWLAGKLPNRTTLWLFNVAMENGP